MLCCESRINVSAALHVYALGLAAKTCMCASSRPVRVWRTDVLVHAALCLQDTWGQLQCITYFSFVHQLCDVTYHALAQLCTSTVWRTVNLWLTQTLWRRGAVAVHLLAHLLATTTSVSMSLRTCWWNGAMTSVCRVRPPMTDSMYSPCLRRYPTVVALRHTSLLGNT